MHTSIEAGSKQNAEQRFRASYERLKRGEPELLPKGTPVTQNNVAKEAGCDPSALKKARFPSLVAEIQDYARNQTDFRPESENQKRKKARDQNRSIREMLAETRQQRDKAQSLLADANLLIVDLHAQISDLNRRLEEFQPVPPSIFR